MCPPPYLHKIKKPIRKTKEEYSPTGSSYRLCSTLMDKVWTTEWIMVDGMWYVKEKISRPEDRLQIKNAEAHKVPRQGLKSSNLDSVGFVRFEQPKA